MCGVGSGGFLVGALGLEAIWLMQSTREREQDLERNHEVERDTFGRNNETTSQAKERKKKKDDENDSKA